MNLGQTVLNHFLHVSKQACLTITGNNSHSENVLVIHNTPKKKNVCVCVIPSWPGDAGKDSTLHHDPT